MKKKVIVALRVHGFHHWPEAPAEVAYLAQPHRHLFHVRVEVAVGGSDREVEFHLFQRDCLSALKRTFEMRSADEFDFGTRSCEHIAEELLSALGWDSVVAVEVWEDGENGSRVER